MDNDVKRITLVYSKTFFTHAACNYGKHYKLEIFTEKTKN
jgi:hypothetical protein